MTDVTIIGTGNMGRAIGTRMVAGGHSVTLLSRDPAGAADLVRELQQAAVKGATVQAKRLGSPIKDEVVVLAVAYRVAGDLVRAEADHLADKILIDVTNPLNATYDGLATGDISAAEEIAGLLPATTRVVKAFNTTFAGVLVAGQVAGQSVDVLMAGDDEVAKKTVSTLISDGGLRPLDVGPLARARQLEALGLLGILMQQSLGTGFASAWKLLS